MAARDPTRPEPDRLSQGTIRWEVSSTEMPWHRAEPKFYEGLYYSPGEVAKFFEDRVVMKAKSCFELIPCYIGRLFGLMTQYEYEGTFSLRTKCSVPQAVQILRGLLDRKRDVAAL